MATNPESDYQPLNEIMVEKPEVVELGVGTITRRNSIDMPLYGPIRVYADYTDNFRRGWYSFRDHLGDLLVPGNSPARIITSSKV